MMPHKCPQCVGTGKCPLCKGVGFNEYEYQYDAIHGGYLRVTRCKCEDRCQDKGGEQADGLEATTAV